MPEPTDIPVLFYEAGFVEGHPGRPHGFVQWKGTDVCMDVYCPCGEQFHIDAEFAYFVRCLACGRRFEVGCNVALRESDKAALEASCQIDLDQDCPTCQSQLVVEGNGERVSCTVCDFRRPSDG